MRSRWGGDVTVSVNAKPSVTQTYRITVTAVLPASLTVDAQGAKKDYKVGEEVVKTGLTVTVNYNKPATSKILQENEYTLKVAAEYLEGGKLKAGENITVTVKYTEKDTTVSGIYTVNAYEKVLDSITVAAGTAKTEFPVNGTFSHEGIVVTAHYEHPELYPDEKVETGYEVSTPDMSEEGDKQVEVSYQGKKATYTVHVSSAEITGIAVKEGTPDKKEFYTDCAEEEFRAAIEGSLKVTVSYNNGTSREVDCNGGVTFDLPTLTTAGNNIKVTVHYEEQTATFEITVIQAVIESIEIDAGKATTEYFKSEEAKFSAAGIVVTATWNSTKTTTLEEGTENGKYTVTKPAWTVGDEVQVTVSVNGTEVTGTYTIKIKEAEITSIDIETEGVKQEYFVGDTINTDKLVVTAHYNDGTAETVQTGDYTVTPEAAKYEGGKFSEAGSVTVTVSYKGQSKTYTVTVKAAEIDSIALSGGYKTSYFEGDTLDTSALVVTATYNNKETKQLQAGEYTVTVDADHLEGNKLKAGERITVTVSVNAKPSVTQTYEITVTAVVPTTLTVDAQSAKKDYKVGDAVEKTGLKVTVTYNKPETSKVLQEGEYELEVEADYYADGKFSAHEGIVVTVKYTENGTTVSNTYAVNAYAKVLDSITVDENDAETEFPVNGAFSHEGIVVTAHYQHSDLYPDETIEEGDGTTGYQVTEPDMQEEGEKQVEVTYQGKKATYQIHVTSAEITGIAVKEGTPTTTQFYTDCTPEEFQTEIKKSLQITVSYNNSTTRDISSGFTFTTPTLTEANDSAEVTVTYQGQEAKFTVKIVKAEITSLTVDAGEATTEYYASQEEDFSYDNIKVTANWNSGKHTTLESGYTAAVDTWEVGEAVQVTVTYTGNDAKDGTATGTYTIKIIAVELTSIEIDTQNVKKEYFVGDTINTDKLVVTAHYNDDTTETVQAGNYTVTPEAEKYVENKFSVDGSVTVTVSYQEQSKNYTVTVKKVLVTELELAFSDESEKSFFVGHTFTHETLTVTAKCNNSTQRQLNAEDYTVAVDGAYYAEGKFTQAGGSVTVTVTYEKEDAENGSVQATYTVEVKEVKITELELGFGEGDATVQTTFTEGDEFNSDNLKVTAKKNDGTSEVLSDGYKVEVDPEHLDEQGKLTAGNEITVTVTYTGTIAHDGEITKTYTITVNAKDVTPTGITVETDGAATKFYQGETFSAEGIQVKLQYSDGHTDDLTPEQYTVVTEPDMNTASDAVEITVKYNEQEEFTNTYTIQIVAIDHIEIETDGVVKTFAVGEELTHENLKVTAYYKEDEADDHSRVVESGYTVALQEGEDMNSAGTKHVVVTYLEKTETYEIAVLIAFDGTQKVTFLAGQAELENGGDLQGDGDQFIGGISNAEGAETIIRYKFKSTYTGAAKVYVSAGWNENETDAYEIFINDVSYGKYAAKGSWNSWTTFIEQMHFVVAFEAKEYTVEIRAVNGSYNFHHLAIEPVEPDKIQKLEGSGALKYEAESAILGGSCNVQGGNGSSNDGFVGGLGAGGNLIFLVSSKKEINVELWLSAAGQIDGGGVVENAFDVYLNGDKLTAHSVGTGNWTNWTETLVQRTHLVSGLNIIEFRVVAARGNVNVDYLKIAPALTYAGETLECAPNHAETTNCDVQDYGSVDDKLIIGDIGENSSFSFDILANAAATVDLTVKIAGGVHDADWTIQGEGRIEVWINDTLQTTLDIQTGGITTFQPYEVKGVTLNEGDNTIEFRVTKENVTVGEGQAIGFNFDHMTVSPAAGA